MWYTQFWKTIGTQDCSQGQANLPWPGNFSCPFGGIPRPVSNAVSSGHDHVIKWKHLPRYWPFVRGIHRSPVNSPHKWPVTRSFDVFFDLRLYKRLSKHSWGWFLRRYHAHDDVTVMQCVNLFDWNLEWCLPGWGGWVPICNMRQSACRCKTLTMFFFSNTMKLHFENFTYICYHWMYMGQVSKLWLSCYLVLLSNDSKTR